MERCKECLTNCRDYIALAERIEHFKIGAEKCIVFKQKEKPCNDCINFETKLCTYNGTKRCSSYELKESKPMSKVIFENEEEAIEFFNNTTLHDGRGSFLTSLKRNGYIRKSPVEEAEAFYEKMKRSRGLTVLEVEMNGAIQHLKSENEVLKNGIKNK